MYALISFGFYLTILFFSGDNSQLGWVLIALPKRTFVDCWFMVFSRVDALPVIQPTVSRH